MHQTHESDGPLLNYHLTREGSSAAINRGRGNSSSAQQALEMWKSLRQYHKPQSTENLSQLWNVNEFDKFFSNEPRILYARPTYDLIVAVFPQFQENQRVIQGEPLLTKARL